MPSTSSFDELVAPGLSEPIQTLFLFDHKLDTTIVSYDFLGLTYFCLSRIEEINPPESYLDKHSRFSADFSHASIHNYLQHPIVDEWFTVIRDYLKYNSSFISLPSLNAKTTVTHDVDRPSKYFNNNFTSFSRSFLRNISHLRFTEILLSLYIKLLPAKYGFNADPYNTFDFISSSLIPIDTDSTYYFMMGASHTTFDLPYNPYSQNILSLKAKLISQNSVLGFHPSYYASEDFLVLLKESREFQKWRQFSLSDNSFHTRMHYLRFIYPDTFYQLASLGVTNDSSMGYASKPGYRASTCHPFPMFDPLLQQEIGIVQQPLILMDSSLFSTSYENLESTEAFMRISFLYENSRHVYGNFVSLWHNTSLTHDSSKNFFLDFLKLLNHS